MRRGKRGDWERMPSFVRPMARAGFSAPHRHSAEAWERLLGELARSLETGDAVARQAVTGRHGLSTRLVKLVEHDVGAPERAARFMGAELAETLGTLEVA